MKKTKRILALILSAALLFCTGLVSLAEDETPEETDSSHLLTLVQSEHGTLKTEKSYDITDTGQLLIPSGTEVRITAETEEGYETDQLLLNGESLEPDENGNAVFLMPPQDSTLELTVTEKASSLQKQSDGGNTSTKPEASKAAASNSAGKPVLRSAGETITSAYIKKGAEIPGGIDVIQWTDGEWTSLDHWSEGILGTSPAKSFSAQILHDISKKDSQ